MQYSIKIAKQAEQELIKLKKSEPSAYKKAKSLLIELQDHPTKGTGQPEQLKHEQSNRWSRRITKKHRLVYQIDETDIYVLIISVHGHYNDK